MIKEKFMCKNNINDIRIDTSSICQFNTQFVLLAKKLIKQNPLIREFLNIFFDVYSNFIKVGVS